jgi:hypothetical protein
MQSALVYRANNYPKRDDSIDCRVRHSQINEWCQRLYKVISWALVLLLCKVVVLTITESGVAIYQVFANSNAN